MASAIAEQVAAGEPGIIGVMVESFLVDGRQDLTDRSRLTVGQSITDECMGWDMTVPVLRELASAVRTRRPLLANREQQLSLREARDRPTSRSSAPLGVCARPRRSGFVRPLLKGMRRAGQQRESGACG